MTSAVIKSACRCAGVATREGNKNSGPRGSVTAQLDKTAGECAQAMAAQQHALVDEEWSAIFTAAVENEPCPQTVLDSLQPMADRYPELNFEVLRALVHDKDGSMRSRLQQLGCPEFDVEDALAIWVYSLPNPAVFHMVNVALRADDKKIGEGGLSPKVRACLPYIKLLNCALERAPSKFRFSGRCFRGDKWVWPSPGQHDPAGYFVTGQEFSWHAFKSSSRKLETVYNEAFCGQSGPRTIFTIEGVYGVLIKEFSELPSEEEVLFPVNTMFRVIYCQKRMKPEHLRPDCKIGFPDEVHLQQPLGEELLEELQLEYRRANVNFNMSLGRGSFAQVYTGTYRLPGRSQITPVAFKLFDNSVRLSPAMRQRIFDEAQLGLRLRHDNIITLFGILEIPERGVSTVLELAAGGSLERVLHEEHKIEWETRVRWLQEITAGLACLHDTVPRAILHRDLKAANVLLSSQELSIAVAKVADFGVAETMNTQAMSRRSAGHVGTLAWKAPETFDGVFTAASDVFALGMTAFEIVTRQPPWQGLSEAEITAKASDRFKFEQYLLDEHGVTLEQQKRGWEQHHPLAERRPDLRALVNKECPNQLLSLIESCWEDETHQRPTVPGLLHALEEIMGAITGVVMFENPLSPGPSGSPPRLPASAPPVDRFEAEDSVRPKPHGLLRRKGLALMCMITILIGATVFMLSWRSLGTINETAPDPVVGLSDSTGYPRIQNCRNLNCSLVGRPLNNADIDGLDCATSKCSMTECCELYPSCKDFDCSGSPNGLMEYPQRHQCLNFQCSTEQCCTVLPPVPGSMCRQGWSARTAVLEDGSSAEICEPVPYCEWHQNPCQHGFCNSTDRDHFSCRCAPGWSGFLCDIPRPFCAWSNNPCRNGGVCTSRGQDSYVCTNCDEGWQGQRCDAGIPYCEWHINPCDNNGACVSNGRDQFSCTCGVGWSGHTCDEPVPYCDWHEDTCPHADRCQSSGRDSYTCSGCHSGWTGTTCDDEIPFCDWNVSPCQHGATCVSNGRDLYSCSYCGDGWQGRDCDQPQDYCEWHINPCDNNGACVSNGRDQYTCTCGVGWSGHTCDEPVPYCDWHDNPCMHGSICESTSRTSYTCSSCTSGWSGTNCDLPVPYCNWNPNPCQNSGTCSSSGRDDYTCSCSDSWRGRLCDETWYCQSGPCYNGAECVESDDENEFSCECVYGTTGTLCGNNSHEWWKAWWRVHPLSGWCWEAAGQADWSELVDAVVDSWAPPGLSWKMFIGDDSLDGLYWGSFQYLALSCKLHGDWVHPVSCLFFSLVGWIWSSGVWWIGFPEFGWGFTNNGFQNAGLFLIWLVVAFFILVLQIVVSVLEVLVLCGAAVCAIIAGIIEFVVLIVVQLLYWVILVLVFVINELCCLLATIFWVVIGLLVLCLYFLGAVFWVAELVVMTIIRVFAAYVQLLWFLGCLLSEAGCSHPDPLDIDIPTIVVLVLSCGICCSACLNRME